MESHLNRIAHFCDFFSEYADNYLIIGGSACSVWYSDAEPHFRGTNDMDVVLILELLNQSFLDRFKLYLQQESYQSWEKHVLDESTQKVMYRFSSTDSHGPTCIELLSRKGDLLHLESDAHLSPLTHDGEYTGLSCILVHEAYYDFLRSQASSKHNCSLVSIPGLIMLKIKAYLNLHEAKRRGIHARGSDGSSRNINKHRNDIFFMLTDLRAARGARISLPEQLRTDLTTFMNHYPPHSEEWSNVFQNLRVRYGRSFPEEMEPTDLLEQLTSLFI